MKIKQNEASYCLACSQHVASKFCSNCDHIMAMARRSYMMRKTPADRVAEIEGQLAFFDTYMRELGNHTNVTSWNVINRIMKNG